MGMEDYTNANGTQFKPEDDAKLLVSFESVPIQVVKKEFDDPKDSKRATREWTEWEDEERVTIITPGQFKTMDSVIMRVDPAIRVRFAAQYQRFKDNRAQHFDGTPLREWPKMTSARIKTMETFNLFTVEHIAGASDTVIQSMGMGSMQLRQEARAWLKGRQSTEASREREAMANEMAEMKAQIAELTGKTPVIPREDVADEPMTAAEQLVMQKRGPGRPRREEAAA